MDWQPIDTAPKDGTAIWLLVDGHPYIGYCGAQFMDKRSWYLKASFKRRERPREDEIFGCYAYGVNPNGWMPLPEPPKD